MKITETLGGLGDDRGKIYGNNWGGIDADRDLSGRFMGRTGTGRC